METAVSPAIDSLNNVLRSSIAASETYGKAIRKIESHQDHHAVALRVIYRNHLDHTSRLKREISRLGGKPDESSGAWGVVANTIEGAATLFGDAAAVRALKEGERHALSAAIDALPYLEPPAADYLLDTVTNDYVQHLELLDAILKPAA